MKIEIKFLENKKFKYREDSHQIKYDIFPKDIFDLGWEVSVNKVYSIKYNDKSFIVEYIVAKNFGVLNILYDLEKKRQQTYVYYNNQLFFKMIATRLAENLAETIKLPYLPVVYKMNKPYKQTKDSFSKLQKSSYKFRQKILNNKSVIFIRESYLNG